MPCQSFYKLQKKHRGDWILKASCTVKDKTLTAYGAATLTVMEDISLTNEQCKSVEAINTALESEIKKLQENNAKSEADMYTITAYLTDTKPNTYRGQIRIEDWRVDGVELWVQIMGVGQNQGVEKIPVTLTGGIYSDTIPFSVAGINFKGAGKEYKTWPEDEPNAGKLNVAFDGNSESNLSNCTFTGPTILPSSAERVSACSGGTTPLQKTTSRGSSAKRVKETAIPMRRAAYSRRTYTTRSTWRTSTASPATMRRGVLPVH